MDIYTVSLFGHRSLLNPLSAEERLEREVYKLLKNHKGTSKNYAKISSI